jgi:hypothetical protein
MIYDINLFKVVKEALEREFINEDIIEKILYVVEKIKYNWCRIPIFDALKFNGVENGKNGPLAVSFDSCHNNRMYKISLVYENEGVELYDDTGYFMASFTKECTDVRFLYDGKNVIRFIGNKPNTDDECYEYVQENGGFKDINAYVYLGTDDLNLSGLSYDYRYGSIEANDRGSEYYHYASFSTMVDDGYIETKKLEDLEECILLGIDAYDDARKKYIDRLGKILSLKK